MVYNLRVTSLWFSVLKLFLFCFCWNVLCQSQLPIIMPRWLYLQSCQACLLQCLCLCLDDFLTLEAQLRCFFPQEAFLSATVEVWHHAEIYFILYPWRWATSDFLPLLVSSLREELGPGGSLSRALPCTSICSLKMVWVDVIAMLMGFFFKVYSFSSPQPHSWYSQFPSS